MSEQKQLTVPELGDFEDVEVIEVLVAPGDPVAIEDPLITLETDKATMDVPGDGRRHDSVADRQRRRQGQFG